MSALFLWWLLIVTLSSQVEFTWRGRRNLLLHLYYQQYGASCLFSPFLHRVSSHEELSPEFINRLQSETMCRIERGDDMQKMRDVLLTY